MKPKQCVKNDAGFVISVKWYRPNDLELSETDDGEVTIDQKGEAFAKASPTFGVRNCVDGSDNIAVLSIKGGKFADDITRGAIFGSITLLTGAACAAVVVGTGGTATKPCIALTKIALGAAISVASLVPDEHKMVGIEVPNNTHITKVIGTIWQPAIRQGNEIPY